MWKRLGRAQDPIAITLYGLRFILGIALAMVICRAVGVHLWRHSFLGLSIVGFTIAAAGLGGLITLWDILYRIEFWKCGYRIRTIRPREYFKWQLGPKECIYEERAASGEMREIPFVRHILADGYPAPGEIRIPGSRNWDAKLPSWANGRRTEIIGRIVERSGSRTRFVDEGEPRGQVK